MIDEKRRRERKERKKERKKGKKYIESNRSERER